MNWLQIVKELSARSSTWIETFYKDHTGLVTLLALVATFVGLYFAYRTIPKPDANASEDAPQLDPDLRLQLLNRVQIERVDSRLRQESEVAGPTGGPVLSQLPTLHIESNGEIPNSDHELELAVLEAEENVRSGRVPPFRIDLNQDVLANTSRDIATVLSLGPRGSIELSARVSELEHKANLDSEEREERLTMQKLLRAVGPHSDKFNNCVLALLCDPVVKRSGYINDERDVVRVIRELARVVFGRHDRRPDETGIDLYRVREPELSTRIYLSHDEMEQLVQTIGLPRTALTIRGGWGIGELGYESIRDKALPAILVEIHNLADKKEFYKPSNQFAELTDWFIGLS